VFPILAVHFPNADEQVEKTTCIIDSRRIFGIQSRSSDLVQMSIYGAFRRTRHAETQGSLTNMSKRATVPPPSSASRRISLVRNDRRLRAEILARPPLNVEAPWLIFLSPSGNDDGLFRAVAAALGSAFPIALIRPKVATHGRHRYATERLGADIQHSIRMAIGPAKFIICGHSLGGLLAMEVARQKADGNCIGLAMIESPMPGHPHFLPTTRQKLKAYLRSFHAHAMGPNRYGPRKLLLECVRVPLYHVLLRSRDLRVPWLKFRAVRFAADFARGLPFQQVPPIRVPLLTILSERSGEDIPLDQRRLDWEIKATAGFEQHILPDRYTEIDARSHVDHIWRCLGTWAAALPATPRARRSFAHHADPPGQLLESKRAV
jgi:pimeloyl-ACP methyl ester carboxylesterase